MRRLLALLLSIVLITSLASCSSEVATNGKKTIVCTIYPQYNWVMEILGDHVDDYNVVLLLDNGTDLHSFQPGANDIITISTCDLFIYNGGLSDSWVEEVLSTAKNENMITVNMINAIGDSVLTAETVEGMQEDEHHHDHNEECEHEYDEHIWLSLNNASLICDNIYSALCQMAPENKSDFTSTYNNYKENLSSLNEQYTSTINHASRNVLLFADRFPFRYLVEDYDLDYYAAFSGCSSETEASFNTIIFLAEKMDELELPTVCVTESSDKSVAQSVISSTNNSNQSIVVFDSLQSITKKQIEDGATYISIMEKNLEALTKALN